MQVGIILWDILYCVGIIFWHSRKMAHLGRDTCYVIQFSFFCFTHMPPHCKQMVPHNQNSINYILRAKTLHLL